MATLARNKLTSRPSEMVFDKDDLTDFRDTFSKFDRDGNGHVTAEELKDVFSDLGEGVPAYQIRDMLNEVDIDQNGTVEFEEFLTLLKKVRAGKIDSQFVSVVDRVEKVCKQGGTSSRSAEGTTHSFADAEILAFTDFINSTLASDPDVQDLLPIDMEDHDALCKAGRNGLIYCKLINFAAEDTIDPRAINTKQLNTFKIQENLTLAINSAASIGINVVNIGADDLSKGTQHLVLGFLWQIIRIGLLSSVNLQASPGLSSLMEGHEDAQELMALSPDTLLLRWVNFHLERSGCVHRVTNFGDDFADSEAYIYLLRSIAPAEHTMTLAALDIGDLTQRAEAMLADADKMGCRKFVTANDVTSANVKLNMAFVAHMFNMYPAMETAEGGPGGAGGAGGAGIDLDEIEESREDRTFRNWMNSMGVRPRVNRLYNDLADGMVILQLEDKVKPGCVNWDKVNKPPFKSLGSNMKKIENCNYAIEVANELKFSVVSIGGQDIYNGIPVLTLAVVWQLMRAHTISILQQLSDEAITDPQIVEWANNKLSKAGKSTSITGFKDPSISSALCVIDLVDAIKPKSVDYSFVTAGETEDEQLSNSKYAVSMARKIGAGVYALPEDLVEVKPKMVMTIFACLMARDMSNKKKK
eukprot:m.477582 g.477582  ORF g.477582 m.477582 type:complete len:641 (+) comp20867_c0_seq1:379-2301(+)